MDGSIFLASLLQRVDLGLELGQLGGLYFH
jgi:hypothetical protein